VLLNFPEGALALEKAYADGDYAGAWLYAARILEERRKTVDVGTLAIGALYEFAGESEKAIDWYEVGYQFSGPGVPYVGVNVKSPAIRANSRCKKLLRELRLDYWIDADTQSGE